jgi:hypothetical protein
MMVEESEFSHVVTRVRDDADALFVFPHPFEFTGDKTGVQISM